MDQNFNADMKTGVLHHSRTPTNRLGATVALLLMLPGDRVGSSTPPKPILSDLQGVASWTWADRISWRDDPARIHQAWRWSAAMALKSMQAGYNGLALDEGASESQSTRSPTQALWWVAVSGPVTRKVSAALGWYRTNLGLVGFQGRELAQRFLFKRASRSKDQLVWNLAAQVTSGLALGIGLGMERLAIDQVMTLWPGDSRLRPAADGTFDLPICLHLSGYRATLGIGFSWSGPKWIGVFASARLLTPIQMKGRFSVTPQKPSIQTVVQDRQGPLKLKRGVLVRGDIRLVVSPPYSVLTLGADVEGPGYRKAMVEVDDLAATGPLGTGHITSLPPAWLPRAWNWSVHGSLGARLDRQGLRLLGGFSATSPDRSLCGRLPETPDFRAAFALLVQLGPAVFSASYARRWATTHCDHAFPAAFNPSAGPTRQATERGRYIKSDLVVFTIMMPIP